MQKFDNLTGLDLPTFDLYYDALQQLMSDNFLNHNIYKMTPQKQKNLAKWKRPPLTIPKLAKT